MEEVGCCVSHVLLLTVCSVHTLSQYSVSMAYPQAVGWSRNGSWYDCMACSNLNSCGFG